MAGSGQAGGEDGQPKPIKKTGHIGLAGIDATGTLHCASGSPLVRFVLSDKSRRIFEVERRHFSGDEGWLPVEWGLRLEPAVRDAVRRLGPKGPKDAFFEWG